jgi:hypothetical protein
VLEEVFGGGGVGCSLFFDAGLMDNGTGIISIHAVYVSFWLSYICNSKSGSEVCKLTKEWRKRTFYLVRRGHGCYCYLRGFIIGVRLTFGHATILSNG